MNEHFQMLSNTHILVMSVTLLFFGYIFIINKLLYWRKRNVHGPKPFPLIGNLWKVVTLQAGMGSLLKEFYDAGDEPVMGIFAFGEPILLIRSLEIVKQICVSDFHFFHDRVIAAPKHNDIFSNFLFIQRNSEWKSTRIRLTPMFSSAKLKKISDITKDVGHSMTSFLKKYPGLYEGKKLCYDFAIEVVARSVLGISANCFTNESSSLKQTTDKMFQINLRNAFCQSAYFFKPYLVDLFHLNFYSTSVQQSYLELFWDCMRKIENGQINFYNFLGLFKEIRNKDASFDGNKMAAQGFTFFSAGTETTASTIAFTLYELCMNPNSQSKLREEIERVIKSHEELTYEGLQEIKYLEYCILETLRKYPPLSFLDRKCNTNYKIPGTDIIIEKGTGIYIPLLGIHYDARYFPNPEQFYPERFIDNSEASKMVLSFGIGPRNCIAARFGMLIAKIAIVSILRNFMIKKSPQTPSVIEFNPWTVMLSSNVGLPMLFVPIESDI